MSKWGTRASKLIDIYPDDCIVVLVEDAEAAIREAGEPLAAALRKIRDCHSFELEAYGQEWARVALAAWEAK